MPLGKFSLNLSQPIVFNRNYIRSTVGLLKITECIFGFVSWMSIWLSCRSSYDPYLGTYSGFVGGDIETFTFLSHFTCLFISMLIITVYYLSIIASTIIPKTVFELSYNLIATLLISISSLILLFTIINRNQQSDGFPHEPGFAGKIVCSIFGLFNSLIYCFDVYFSYQSFIQG